MVDAVVSFTLNRLADFLIYESVFLGRVRQEVQWLKDELGWMQCYISSAEEKQNEDPIVRKWLNDITKIAYDVEDVLDKFILQVHDEETDHEDTIKETMPTGCFRSMSSCIKYREKVNLRKKVVNLHDIGKDIEELKIRINDLPRIRELYQLESSSNKVEGNSCNSLARLRQLRRTTSFSIEEKVVGHEDGTTQLLAKILDTDPRRSVVSIYGMGGLGKTTLARKLYHHLHVKRKFHCRAWVCVSQDYNAHDLLIRIIRSFGFTTVKTEELQHMGDEDLERHLHESLQERSYLLVIDDIWKKEAWECIKRAFPAHCNNGSRVVITTRSKEVAESLEERTYVHQLRFLTFDESWQLFCEKAFGKPNANDVEEELKTLGIEMVQKCEGLPLAIIVLGGLLSKKTKPRGWKVVRDHIWQDLKKGSIHIPHLFALSFNDLSYQLKLGFLYLSLFPEDFEIDVDELIRLWVAEGFISQDGNWKKMEDVARDNFHELINRSLIQIGKISWGRVATCRVHDLLRELAIEKARELNFLNIYDQMKHSIGDSSFVPSCRRGAFYSGIENRLWLQQSNPSLRSLLLFDRYGYKQDIMMKIGDMYTEFQFLRVLKLDGFKVTGGTLSEEIGKLIHLKYLGLRKSSVICLPQSIFNLRRLQTLDLFSNSVKPPNEFSKLQELRHLFGIFTSEDLQIDSLTKLQSLKYVQSKLWMKVNTEKLVNLRELRINNLRSTERISFCFDSIAKLKRLEHLMVQLVRNGCFESLQPLTDCSNLMDLRLHGKIEKLPKDIHKVLPNLECLLLKNSRLKDDPMPLLEKLPSLMILHLGSEFYSGKNLFCSAQGFPQLEIVKLDDDDGLEEWQAEEGAMPKLRGLTIPENSLMKISERLREIPPPAE